MQPAVDCGIAIACDVDDIVNCESIGNVGEFVIEPRSEALRERFREAIACGLDWWIRVILSCGEGGERCLIFFGMCFAIVDEVAKVCTVYSILP